MMPLLYSIFKSREVTNLTPLGDGLVAVGANTYAIQYLIVSLLLDRYFCRMEVLPPTDLPTLRGIIQDGVPPRY